MGSAEQAIESAVVKLGQLLINEVNFLNEVHGDIYWMQSELRWMSCFLEDADAKRKNGDKRTQNWIREVTNIAHEAEDVVDNFMLQIERNRKQKSGLFSMHFCSPSKLAKLHYIGTDILQIKTKIHSVSESKDRYGITNLGESTGSMDVTLRAQRNLNPDLLGNKFIAGFGVKKDSVLNCLRRSEVEKLLVVPIVGMGGLGKTTLATMVYNSDLVKDWFVYHAWVAVSEEFKLHELLHNLIKQVGGDFEQYNNMDTDTLTSALHDCLKKQRYIIVLDDIWEQDVWQQLKDVFPDVENGSRILITTRFFAVGKLVDPSNEPYMLPLLDDTESWELFLKVVFPSKDSSTPKCPKALEPLGRKLVKKCGGLPLGLKILGGLLSVTKPTIKAWEEVATKWKYQNKSSDHLRILALSYNKLPNAFMKSCFLYIGNYPEDCIIKASELTKIWIAEGFIPEEEDQTFEETAIGYLDQFVLRCMVQVVDRTKTSKRVKHFRIHDLFRSWCISEAREDGFFRICTSSSDTSSRKIVDARRLIVYKSTLDDKFHDLSYNARAFLGFNYLSAGSFLLRNIGHNFKLLKVIYLKFPEDGEIHKSKLLKDISGLIHLRNITLISEALTYLPSSMGKLHNLETLNVKHTSVLKLPTTLHRIQNLRHLYTRGITVRSSVNWKSRNIQTIDSIKAGIWMLKDFTKLLNIRKLSIYGVKQICVRGLTDSLHKLKHLKSLCLESDGHPAPPLFTSFKSHNPLSKLVLINWSNVDSKFPENLISIRLSGCNFKKGVMASLEKLSDLANLDLLACCIHSDDKFLWSANGFQELENLRIGEMRGTMLDWRISKGALSKIKCMTIVSSLWLQALPYGLEHLKSLQKLELVDFVETSGSRPTSIMEDQYRIPQTTYVTLDGIQMVRRQRTSGLEHLSGIRISDDEPITTSFELSAREIESYMMGAAKVKVIRTLTAALDESKYRLRIEVMGLSSEEDRFGVDIIAILDVNTSTSEVLKSAMKFLIGKLSSVDRLSIVILSNNKPVQVCPLRQVTESSLDDINSLVHSVTCQNERNISAGVQLGVEVINSRHFTTGRMAAIMLMLDLDPIKYNYQPYQVQLGNVPLFTFGVGKYSDQSINSTEMELKEMSNASMGGTFSHIPNSDSLNSAFSICLGGLLSVALSEGKLNMRQINSTIHTVSAVNSTQSIDSENGSVTINFGDIYVNQQCKVMVDLILPAVGTRRIDDPILEIIMWYRDLSSSAGKVIEHPIFIGIDRASWG